MPTVLTKAREKQQGALKTIVSLDTVKQGDGQYITAHMKENQRKESTLWIEPPEAFIRDYDERWSLKVYIRKIARNATGMSVTLHAFK